MQFVHDSTSAYLSVRQDSGQLAWSPATKQIHDADRRTAVELTDLIQLSSIRCLLKRLDLYVFQLPQSLEFIQNSQMKTKTSRQNWLNDHYSLAVNIE